MNKARKVAEKRAQLDRGAAAIRRGMLDLTTPAELKRLRWSRTRAHDS